MLDDISDTGQYYRKLQKNFTEWKIPGWTGKLRSRTAWIWDPSGNTELWNRGY